MEARSASRLSWSLFGLSVLLSLCAVVLRLSRVDDSGAYGNAGLGAFVVPVVLGWFGALVAARRRRNPIGWLLLAIGVIAAFIGFAEEYAIYGLRTRPGVVPWPGAFAWLTESAAMAQISLLAAALALFPTGQPLSRRWSLLLWVIVGANLLFTIGSFELWPRRDAMIALNTPDPAGPGYVIRLVGTSGVMLSAVAAGVSLVVRFKRALGYERTQMKWVAYAAAVGILSVPLAFGLNALIRLPSQAVDVIAGLSWIGLPVGMAVAVLRYRLYDIDRIINRTLVYGILAAALAGCYAAGSLAFAIVVGAEGNAPSWLVAAATLAAAAVFRPTRRAIQAAVDRRFNRRKYDATRIIETFGGRLRDAIDIDALAEQLCTHVGQAMQPATMRLWLLPSKPPRAVNSGRRSTHALKVR